MTIFERPVKITSDKLYCIQTRIRNYKSQENSTEKQKQPFFTIVFLKSGIDAINWTSYHPQKPQFSIKNKDLVAFEFPHELILDGVENYGDCS